MPDPDVNNTTGGAAPWYSGLDADGLSYIPTKGWDKLDAPTAAATIATAYRNLEKLHGSVTGGRDALVMPKTEDAPETHAAFWAKLGTPADPSGYNLEGLKYSDGRSVEGSLQDALRAAALKARMPASMLPEVAQAMVAHQEQAAKDAQNARDAAAIANKTALDAKWGAEVLKKKFVAAQGMDALKAATGHDFAAASQALESVPGSGYAEVMEMWHAIGAMMGEARFVPGGGQTAATSKEGAQAQLEALMADEGWRARWAKGGAAEIEQKRNLIMKITGQDNAR